MKSITNHNHSRGLKEFHTPGSDCGISAVGRFRFPAGPLRKLSLAAPRGAVMFTHLPCFGAASSLQMNAKNPPGFVLYVTKCCHKTLILEGS